MVRTQVSHAVLPTLKTNQTLARFTPLQGATKERLTSLKKHSLALKTGRS